jgi:antirestriction protein ArdC
MTYAATNSTTTTAPHRKNAAATNTSPDQQRNTQRENPTQQAIKKAVDFLLEQLAAGKSETLSAYLAAMARFHKYNFGNIMAIARQRPTATHVAGFHTWKELGRFVKRGEKGIQIFAPMMGKRRKGDDAAQATNAKQEERPTPMLIGFRAVYVFDSTQTEGAELPEMEHDISGEVGEYRERLIAMLDSQNIALEYSEDIAPALGVSYGGRIALLPGQQKAEEFTTLVHELAHELLHKAERRTGTTATIRETEAEAVAFIVGQAIGLEMGTASSDYIQMYAGDVALLTESLHVIQQTSALILDAIQAEDVVQTNNSFAEVA